jgi:hypothetical protein
MRSLPDFLSSRLPADLQTYLIHNAQETALTSLSAFTESCISFLLGQDEFLKDEVTNCSWFEPDYYESRVADILSYVDDGSFLVRVVLGVIGSDSFWPQSTQTAALRSLIKLEPETGPLVALLASYNYQPALWLNKYLVQVLIDTDVELGVSRALEMFSSQDPDDQFFALWLLHAADPSFAAYEADRLLEFHDELDNSVLRCAKELSQLDVNRKCPQNAFTQPVCDKISAARHMRDCWSTHSLEATCAWLSQQDPLFCSIVLGACYKSGRGDNDCLFKQERETIVRNLLQQICPEAADRILR